MLLDAALADSHEADYAAVITEHEVSARGEVQIVVPLVPSNPEYDDPEDDVPTTGRWMAAMGADVTSGRWAVPFLFTVHQHEESLARVGHLVPHDELEQKDRRRVVTRLEQLRVDPRLPGCEKLSGQEKYRLRRGDYRILYEVLDRELIVTVVRIGNRRDAYR